MPEAFVQWGGRSFMSRRCAKAVTAARCAGAFSDAIRELEEYKHTHESLAVPYEYTSPSGYVLGRWVEDQRAQYDNGSLSDASFQRLNGLGFIWDLEAAAWAASFEEFRGRRGAAQDYLPELGTTLHGWLMEQTTLRLEGRLGPVREQCLANTGYQWLLSSSKDEEEMVSILAQAGLQFGRDYDRRHALHIEPRQIGSFVRSRVFPDFIIYTDWGCVILEVDELQHEGSGLEDVEEMLGLSSAIMAAQPGGKRSDGRHCFSRGLVHIVRYNPHAFAVDTLLGSYPSVAVADLHRRMKVIEAIQHVPSSRVEISYLFFDETQGWPKVVQQGFYPPELRQLVRRVHSLHLPWTIHGAP